MIAVLTVFLGAILAFSLSSVVGGGASLVLIPLLALIVPISEVPGSLALGTFTSALGRSIALNRKIRWDLVAAFVPTALPSVALGAWLLCYVDPLIVTWLSALFLVSNLPCLLRCQTVTTQAPEVISRFHVAVIGVLTGIISGLTGAVGLIFNSFYLNLRVKTSSLL